MVTEQELKRMGILLSRQTLANWMIKCASIFQPIANKMHAGLLEKEVLHADETTSEVLCEPDGPAQTTSYIWIYHTSGCDVPIVLYDCQEGRSGSFAKEYLNGFKDYLNTVLGRIPPTYRNRHNSVRVPGVCKTKVQRSIVSALQ